MWAEILADHLKGGPFRPFWILLTTGERIERIEVRRPDQVATARGRGDAIVVHEPDGRIRVVHTDMIIELQDEAAAFAWEMVERIKTSGLHGTAKAVLRAIAKFCDYGRNFGEWPVDAEALREEIGGGIQRRQILKWLKRLDEEGWIDMGRVGLMIGYRPTMVPCARLGPKLHGWNVGAERSSR